MSTDLSTPATGILGCIRYAAGTDIGKRREENQDSFGAIENERFKFYIVADGMGGVKGGAIASSIAVKVLTETLKDKPELSVSEVKSAVQTANTQIFEKGGEDTSLSGMGTTLTGIAFEATSLFIVNVGDSRIYRFRNKRIKQLSEDHTLVRELIKSGTITEDQAENHPVAHMLTRSLGPTPDIEVDCWVADDGPARGDIYLLCSDGLYNLVSERDLLEILSNSSLDEAIQKCIDLANERGGTDNITVILAQVGEDFPIGPDEFPVDSDSIGIEDTVELYGEEAQIQLEEIEPEANGHAEQHTNGQAQTDGDDNRLELKSTIDIDRISSSLNDPSPEKEKPATAADQTGTGKKAVSKNMPYIFGAGLVVLGILIGVAGGGYWFSKPNPDSNGPFAQIDIPKSSSGNSVSAPVVLDAEVANVGVFLPVVSGSSVYPILPSLSVTSSDGGVAESNSDSNGATYNGLSRHEMDNIVSRRRELQDFLASVSEKLDILGKPIAGSLGDKLKKASGERERLKAQFDSIQVDMDVSARKLAVWYGRQKRLQSTDPINLASEVSVASQSVKEKKEIFERATYAYLQEAEVLRYNPTDAAQDQKVKNLLKVRKDRMAELAHEVQDAVETEVHNADHRIAELTLERDKVQAAIDAAQQEIEFAQTVMGNDSKSKQRIKDDLQKKKQVAQSELEELNQLLPANSSGH